MLSMIAILGKVLRDWLKNGLVTGLSVGVSCIHVLVALTTEIRVTCMGETRNFYPEGFSISTVKLECHASSVLVAQQLQMPRV